MADVSRPSAYDCVVPQMDAADSRPPLGRGRGRRPVGGSGGAGTGRGRYLPHRAKRRGAGSPGLAACGAGGSSAGPQRAPCRHRRDRPGLCQRRLAEHAPAQRRTGAGVIRKCVRAAGHHAPALRVCPSVPHPKRAPLCGRRGRVRTRRYPPSRHRSVRPGDRSGPGPRECATDQRGRDRPGR